VTLGFHAPLNIAIMCELHILGFADAWTESGASAEAPGVDARSPSDVRQHTRFCQFSKLGGAHEDGLKRVRWADAVHARAEIDE